MDLTMTTLIPFHCVYYLYRNHPFLSVRLQIHVWPINFFCFDIGLQYLAHGSITIKKCVAFIHDLDTTLTFDLNFKFIEFFTWLCVWGTAFSSFDLVLPYLSHECITMGHCITQIHDLCMTLTFDLNIKIIFVFGQDRLCFLTYQIWHMGVSP